MSWPREGSRETDEGIIVPVPCDWCRSPTAIIPYKIWARQKEAANLANTVRQTSNRTHVKGSLILKCHGDEPGVGGGVKSDTHGAECTPKTWSESVRAEGRNIVRHDDEWWMNNKNTWGRLNYTKDMSQYSTAPTRTIVPRMGPVPKDAEKFEAQAGATTAPGTAAGSAPSVGDSLRSLGEGASEGALRGGPLGAEAGMITSLPTVVGGSMRRIAGSVGDAEQSRLDKLAQQDGYKDWSDFMAQINASHPVAQSVSIRWRWTVSSTG